MSKYYYYINTDVWTSNKQGLKPGAAIMKTPTHFKITFTEGNGPYSSLKELKRNSPIFKELSKTDPKRCQQILLSKNISEAKNMIWTPEDTSFDLEFIDLIMHATIGRIKKGKITGVHFYDNERVKILEIMSINKITKVWQAKIEFFNIDSQKWILKDKPSTFFPKHWNFANLLEECDLAYRNREKVNDSDHKFRSKTLSNVPVEIIFNKGKMISIYPLLQ